MNRKVSLSGFRKALKPAFFLAAMCLSTLTMTRPVLAGVPHTDAELFTQANALYREGKFAPAAKDYLELIREYPHTATFYYNLGNSLFRLNELGRARLAYEKARLEDPRNKDIRYNLNYIKGLVPYHVEDKRNWYVRAGERVLEYFREKEIYFLGLLVFFVFAAGWVWRLYARHDLSWGPVRKVTGVLLLVLIPLAIAKNIEADVMKDAIVLAKESEVRYGPSPEDQVAFRVGEGVKVDVIDSRKDWSRVLLVNGESGWILNSQIAEVEAEFPEKGKES